MSDIIKSGAHRAEVEQAQQIRAELCESRGLGPVCCGMPATCDSCTKPAGGGHVQRMAELIAERAQLRARVAELEAEAAARVQAERLHGLTQMTALRRRLRGTARQIASEFEEAAARRTYATICGGAA